MRFIVQLILPIAHGCHLIEFAKNWIDLTLHQSHYTKRVCWFIWNKISKDAINICVPFEEFYSKYNLNHRLITKNSSRYTVNALYSNTQIESLQIKNKYFVIMMYLWLNQNYNAPIFSQINFVYCLVKGFKSLHV